MTIGAESELANVNTRAFIAPPYSMAEQVLYQSRAGSTES
jgi:hypothetical protein